MFPPKALTSPVAVVQKDYDHQKVTHETHTLRSTKKKTMHNGESNKKPRLDRVA